MVAPRIDLKSSVCALLLACAADAAAAVIRVPNDAPDLAAAVALAGAGDAIELAAGQRGVALDLRSAPAGLTIRAAGSEPARLLIVGEGSAAWQGRLKALDGTGIVTGADIAFAGSS